MSERRKKNTKFDKVAEPPKDKSATTENTYSLLLSMQKSLDFLSSQYDDIKKDTQLIQTLVQEIKSLKQENKNLKAELKEVNSKINNIEQYSKSFNLEFKGIPTSPDEDTYNIVVDICKAINVNVVQSDIEYCHRTKLAPRKEGNSKHSNEQPIIAKFFSRQARDAILSKKKQFPELSSTDINCASLKSSKIYINEHLTQVNKNLFWLARNTKNIGYKYAWVKNGRIRVRKDENSPIIFINSPEDIPTD
jgi:cell division protein FtsB